MQPMTQDDESMPLSGPKVVEFHFDFGSPNAYFAHKVLPGIVARTGASIRYVPVLLGGIFKATNNRSPFEAFSGSRTSSPMSGWKSPASSPGTSSTASP